MFDQHKVYAVISEIDDNDLTSLILMENQEITVSFRSIKIKKYRSIIINYLEMRIKMMMKRISECQNPSNVPVN